MITANQIKITSQITSADIQIITSQTAFSDVSYIGDTDGSIHIAALPLDRPL